MYTYPENFRAYKAQIAAKYSGVAVKVVSSPPDFKYGETNKTPAFLKKFPTGKVKWIHTFILSIIDLTLIILIVIFHPKLRPDDVSEQNLITLVVMFKVPAYEDGNVTLFESNAIAQYGK